jgi:hypothetical protein
LLIDPLSEVSVDAETCRVGFPKVSISLFDILGCSCSFPDDL